MKIQFTAGPIALDLIETGSIQIAGLSVEGAFVTLDLEGLEGAAIADTIENIATIVREEAGAREGVERFALESVAREIAQRATLKIAGNTAVISQETDQESHSLPTGDETNSMLSQQTSDATETTEELDSEQQAQPEQQPQPARRRRR